MNSTRMISLAAILGTPGVNLDEHLQVIGPPVPLVAQDTVGLVHLHKLLVDQLLVLLRHPLVKVRVQLLRQVQVSCLDLCLAGIRVNPKHIIVGFCLPSVTPRGEKGRVVGKLCWDFENIHSALRTDEKHTGVQSHCLTFNGSDIIILCKHLLDFNLCKSLVWTYVS